MPVSSWKGVEGKAAHIGLALLLVFLSVVPGEYYVRWIAVVLLSLFLGVVLIGTDVRLPKRGSEEEYAPKKKPEFERALNIVKRARKGGGRRLIEEELLEVYHTLTGKSFRELRSNPPSGLGEFYSSKNPYEGLKRALEILEAELDED
jgi:hypothetical protein